MFWEDLKRKYNNYTEQPIEDISIDVLRNMYMDLAFISTEIAFDKANKDTELLLRILLLQHRINFDEESKKYKNPNWDKSCEINGIKFEKEKVYFISDDKLDEYTKQLEYQLKKKETEIVELNNKYNELEDKIKPIIELNIPVKTLIQEYERLNNLEDETDELKLEIKYKDKEIFEFMNSDKGKLFKENKELKKEMTDFRDCWLHKDKIREKLKELDKNELMQKYNYEEIKLATDILKELLQIEN